MPPWVDEPVLLVVQPLAISTVPTSTIVSALRVETDLVIVGSPGRSADHRLASDASCRQGLRISDYGVIVILNRSFCKQTLSLSLTKCAWRVQFNTIF